jgi:23S rRNA pseudouridine955/2504/2580 synthase
MPKPLTFQDLIIWENPDYFVVNKPAGISSLAERDATRASLYDLAKAHWPEAQLCHRLDKETTGALVVAKHPEAYRHLAMQFEAREVDKIYHAVVAGVHDFQQRLVDLPIVQSSKGTVRIDRQLGKFAETTFQTLEAFPKCTLVACEPITGRLHQIRIHLASIDAPILADAVYGGPNLYLSDIKRRVNLKQYTEEQPLMQRVALHAFRIAFKGLQDEPISVEAPYPKDFRALLTQLRKHI